MPDHDIEQRVRERAFYIWIEQGRPNGKDKEHWQQAEAELGVRSPMPENDFQLAQTGTTEVTEPAQRAPGVEAIGQVKFAQVKFAAARDVDQGRLPRRNGSNSRRRPTGMTIDIDVRGY